MSVSKPSARKYIEESPTNTPPSPKRRRPSSPYPRGLSDSLRNLLESVAYLAPTDPSIAPTFSSRACNAMRANAFSNGMGGADVATGAMPAEK